ncbi:fumarylacetoacetate hydrolase family protein [Myxococcota bacterium]|nr:fumarylacetoacetate hydrolase family protein [Myxococcota bacterium]MBU1381674.1 fumarylacetoacetate hydrolase family protein [Myxococcota bacterium]MBU1496517.1 fumarylacetoacetate hydrolase family protein [Myxococcota bacterium]
MIVERRLYNNNEYYVIFDQTKKPQGVTRSFQALLSGSGISASSLGTKLISSDSCLLSPVVPSKIVCVGLNYKLHAEETGKPLPQVPLIFLKPVSAMINPAENIELPSMSTEVHYEGELAVVIGKKLKNVDPKQAMEGIFGYTIMNDVTARDIQRNEKLYTRAKGFDTFAPCGPAIVTDLDILSSTLKTEVNGEIRQKTEISDMIFPPAELISFISKVMTLLPGDIVSTGTPSGVGPLHPGDIVKITIDGIGTLTNGVVEGI